MQTRLTLRLDEDLIRRAKLDARRRGKSISQRVAEYFALMDREPGAAPTPSLPPQVTALKGILYGAFVSREDYRRHLEDKHR